jgi:hypothetical protein
MTHHFKRIRRAAFHHHKTVVRSFHATHKHARRLLKRHKVVIHKVREHSVKTAVAASVTTGLLATPALMASTQQVQADEVQPVTPHEASTAFAQDPKLMNVPAFGPSIAEADKTALFKDRINKVAPGNSANLTADQEAAVSQVIQEVFGVKATAELEGVRLEKSRGIVAGEQHLETYPGQPVSEFFRNRFTGEVADPTANLTGKVPGNPSYVFPARSKAEVTKLDVDREQWYIAAQTFRVEGFQQNPNKLFNFFKYRKMIMINQETGQACVVDIADAGPSPSTGRTFGANNPVLISLGLGSKRTGQVMTLFVDDPGDTIPLGPLTGYNP